MNTFRTFQRSVAILPLFLTFTLSPSVHGLTPEDARITNHAFSSGSELFYGPRWLANALPGSRRAFSRYSLDRAGDVVESTRRHHEDVGILRDAFDVTLFDNMADILWATYRSPSPAAPTANTPYY